MSMNETICLFLIAATQYVFICRNAYMKWMEIYHSVGRGEKLKPKLWFLMRNSPERDYCHCLMYWSAYDLMYF